MLGYPMSIAVGPIGILIGEMLVGSLGFVTFSWLRCDWVR